MNNPIETLPAIHDWHLRQVLEDLHLLSDIEVAQARPEKVRALVAVEPAGVDDPKQAAALKNIPRTGSRSRA
jgi:hypothetical protein